MLQFVSYIQETTIPNILALTEIIMMTSNNATIQNIYQTYQLQSPSTSSSTSSLTPATTFTTCSEHQSLISPHIISTTRQNNVFPIVAWLSACNDETMNIPEHLAAILINIVLLPLSIVVGILVGILSLIFLVIPGRAPATLLILTFGAPFFVVFFILRNIRAIIQDLVNPIIIILLESSNDSTSTRNSADVAMITELMGHLFMVLDSPMSATESLMPRTSNNSNNNKNSNISNETECEMKSVSCKNDKLLVLDILPELHF